VWHWQDVLDCLALSWAITYMLILVMSNHKLIF
jgi:hypothetical protein